MDVKHVLLHAVKGFASKASLSYSSIHYALSVESGFCVHLSSKAKNSLGSDTFNSFYFSKVLLFFSVLKVPFCLSLTSLALV